MPKIDCIAWLQKYLSDFHYFMPIIVDIKCDFMHVPEVSCVGGKPCLEKRGQESSW